MTATSFPSDLEIARSVTPRPIVDIAHELGLRDDEIEHYGRTQGEGHARRRSSALEAANPRGKYVVVTGITPTPLGEGKSTTTVGLAQGLNQHRPARRRHDPPAIARPGVRDQGRRGRRRLQPGHPDGGLQPPPDRRRARDRRRPQPRRRVPRQLTSTTATRWASTRLGIIWPRVVDISDRALRRRSSSASAAARTAYPRETEIDDHGRLRGHGDPGPGLGPPGPARPARPGRAWRSTRDGKPVTVEDLKVAGAMTVLLVDAIKPNLLQTLEGGPAFVHCGPFANIAHGNNSVLADRLALATNDIVVHRGRLRGRHGRREVLRHQVPRLGPASPTPRSSWPRSGPSRCTAAWARSWPASRSTRRCSTENVDAVRPRRARTWPRRSRSSAATACRWSSRSTRSPRTRRPRSRRSRRSPWRPALATRSSRATSRTAGPAPTDLAQAVWAAAEAGAPDFRFLYPDEASLREKIETIATRDLRRGRRRVRAGRGQGARAVRGAGLRPPAGVHGQDAVHRSATTRSCSGRPTGFRVPIRDVRLSAGAGLHHAARSARCGRCRACPRCPAASASTSTRTGTSSACSDEAGGARSNRARRMLAA